jgi:hypothetical protein
MAGCGRKNWSRDPRFLTSDLIGGRRGPLVGLCFVVSGQPDKKSMHAANELRTKNVRIFVRIAGRLLWVYE